MMGALCWVIFAARSDRRSVAARSPPTVVLTLALAFSIPAVVLSTVDRHFWRSLDLPG